MTELLAERRGSDFAELAQWIKTEGLLRRRYGYYAVRIGVDLALLAAVVVAFAMLGDSWWQLLTALVAAVAFTRFAFLGHDAGHRQIFTTRRPNDLVGYGCAVITGISFQWWVGKHNKHHANPNHEDEDPDIDIPALAFSSEQAATKRGLFRWISAYQAYLFFPLLMTQAVMLRLAGFEALIRREIKQATLEGTILIGNLIGYFAAVFLVLSPGKAVLFVLVHQGVMGVYLGCSFAPNHKGMPIVPKGEKLDFLRKQVLTSRNIAGGSWADFLLGGLNRQIEHHLFPNMPRANLRHAQPLVEEFCLQRGIPYSQCGMIESYTRVLRHLHEVGAPLRANLRGPVTVS
jgi:fatty acid desaturase